MRLMLRAVILIMFFSTRLVACDVNLLSIVSGKRPSNVFARNVEKLLQDVQNVGQNIFEKEKASKFLKKTYAFLGEL